MVNYVFKNGSEIKWKCYIFLSFRNCDKNVDEKYEKSFCKILTINWL